MTSPDAGHEPGPDWTCSCGYDFFGGSAAYSWQLFEAHLPSAEIDAALVERAAEALLTSRLPWGTHSDRWADVEWQREFWTEAATIALTTARAIPPGKGNDGNEG